MELKVKIHSIGSTQNVTDTFSKREFIVETQEDYKQYLNLQVIKDKCEFLDKFKKGDEVTVSLNLKGRLWTNKEGVEQCFNTLECWKIYKENPFREDSQPEQQLPQEEISDLPF